MKNNPVTRIQKYPSGLKKVFEGYEYYYGKVSDRKYLFPYIWYSGIYFS